MPSPGANPSGACTPADSNDCDPSRTPACNPKYNQEAAMDWEVHARRLADEAVRRESRWHEPLATVPRHNRVVAGPSL